MAESKNSFIQSKMNKDLDEKLIPNNVYRDALNIAVSRSEGSDVGALEAILGNTKITNSLSGSSKIIGYIVDNANSFAYLFTLLFSCQNRSDDEDGLVIDEHKCTNLIKKFSSFLSYFLENGEDFREESV